MRNIIRFWKTGMTLFLLYVVPCAVGQAETQTVIGHAWGLVKVRFSVEQPTSKTVEILSEQGELVDDFVARKRLVGSLSRLKIGDSGHSFLRDQLFHLTDLQGGTPRRLIEALSCIRSQAGGVGNIGSIKDLEISHDGTKIVFVLYKSIPYKDMTRGSGAIYTCDLESGQTREVVPFGSLCERPSFSPSDHVIAFYRAPLEIWEGPGNSTTDDENGHQLCIVRADGRDRMILSSPPNTIYPGLPSAPAWSPDGQKILFVAQYNNRPGITDHKQLYRPGIYLADLRKTGIERLTPVSETPYLQYPSWSPDGTRFCYIYNHGLMVMDLKTREVRELYRATTLGQCVWSPDSDLIAFAEAAEDSSPSYQLSVISADGKTRLNRILPIHTDRNRGIYWAE